MQRVLDWRPEWDEFHDLGFKALDVLAAVDTDESWSVIERAAEEDRRRVRDIAVSLLKRFRPGR
ncbi:hypothetical protein ABZ863_05225 [Saccharomonospora sp. NPDC046836]|uniref:hypothetical protein n=1 Tax=Saccharomonospora sp. NPDC046836 TaxID=3156921 RepID=UPI0033F294B2